MEKSKVFLFQTLDGWCAQGLDSDTQSMGSDPESAITNFKEGDAPKAPEVIADFWRFSPVFETTLDFDVHIFRNWTCDSKFFHELEKILLLPDQEFESLKFEDEILRESFRKYRRVYLFSKVLNTPIQDIYSFTPEELEEHLSWIPPEYKDLSDSRRKIWTLTQEINAIESKWKDGNYNNWIFSMILVSFAYLVAIITLGFVFPSLVPLWNLVGIPMYFIGITSIREDYENRK